MDYEKIIASLRSQGASDADIESYLRSIGAVEVGPERRKDGKPRGYRTPEQIKRLNKADHDQAADDIANAERTTRGKVLGAFAAPLSEVPGGKALQGALAAAAAPIGEGGYRRGVESVEGAIGSVPGAARIPLKVLGGVASAGALPMGAAASGATYGGLSGLLEANPDRGIGGRAVDAAAGGIFGAALGKLAELGSVAVRGASAKPLSTNLTERSVNREAAAQPHYAAFRKLGDLAGPQSLDDILNLPIVERAGNVVQAESPTLAKLPRTDARVLDAIYKRVGDKAFTAKHGYESAEALDALGAAIEQAAQSKGGTYRAALEAFKEPSKLIGAVKRGREATRFAASPAGTPMAKATTQSPDAFKNWMNDAVTGASPAEREAATEGVLAMVKQGPTLSRIGTLKASVPFPFPSRTLRAGAKMLRETGAEKPALQRLIEALSIGATPTP